MLSGAFVRFVSTNSPLKYLPIFTVALVVVIYCQEIWSPDCRPLKSQNFVTQCYSQLGLSFLGEMGRIEVAIENFSHRFGRSSVVSSRAINRLVFKILLVTADFLFLVWTGGVDPSCGLAQP